MKRNSPIYDIYIIIYWPHSEGQTYTNNQGKHSDRTYYMN